MISKKSDQKSRRRFKIRTGIRAKIKGSSSIPRLAVYRSNHEMYAQLIDDENGFTLASASSLKNDAFDRKSLTNVEIAREVGKQLAQKAAEKNINKVVFDRGGYLYHGRVKALADGAREGGLNF